MVLLPMFRFPNILGSPKMRWVSLHWLEAFPLLALKIVLKFCMIRSVFSIQIPRSAWIGIDFGRLDQDPDPGGKKWPSKKEKVNKCNVWKCWMCFLRTRGVSCSLDVLRWGQGIYLKKRFFKLNCYKFWSSNPSIWIRVRIETNAEPQQRKVFFFFYMAFSSEAVLYCPSYLSIPQKLSSYSIHR